MPDNVLKPDLVAPGNRILGALSTDDSGKVLSTIPASYPQLIVSPDGTKPGTRLLYLSGTSIAAPAISGTVALVIQANPGLTPPLVKAILQYTAQPLANANLVEQGSGLLNVDGAIKIAKTLRADIASAIDAKTIRAGDSLLAPSSFGFNTISFLTSANGPWSLLAFAGGTQLLSGSALLSTYQPPFDPKLSWVGQRVRTTTPIFWSGNRIASNTFVKGFTEATSVAQVLVTNRVVSATTLAGTSSLIGQTGVVSPTARIASWIDLGGGVPMTRDVIVGNGLAPERRPDPQ